jgi:hypothetical protein
MRYWPPLLLMPRRHDAVSPPPMRGTEVRRMNPRLRWHGPLLASLTLLLTGCATTSPGVTRVERVPVLPPSALLTEHPLPLLQGPLNDDLLAVATARAAALQECNGALAALRAWRAEHEK